MSLMKDETNLISTECLVQRVKSGDDEAFGELMMRHHRIVMRTAFAILKSMEDAEDVTQDVFMRVLRKLHTFEGDSSFSTWLTRIAINTSIMHRRKSSRSRELSLDAGFEDETVLVPEICDKAPNPEQVLITTERRTRLQLEIARLPRILKVALKEQIYQETPIDEVARRLGVSLAAAKSRTHRARKMIHSNLQRSSTPIQAVI